eukprot:CAMPEP_0171103736 /NCGR_PEP_ID=MMETSP0766_2-20121228/59266_1 /TAXON_ID=439317 /ORGANISM="Gambierdiscus australes, Strain CAWD 149" /LENGTH=61 /DNA_ID=CAMNT_0011564219 /DNA_START=121 /DNA_END=303 /DNA_ORIENTATION=-
MHLRRNAVAHFGGRVQGTCRQQRQHERALFDLLPRGGGEMVHVHHHKLVAQTIAHHTEQLR